MGKTMYTQSFAQKKKKKNTRLQPRVLSLVTSQNNVAELTAHIRPLGLKKTKCVCVCAFPPVCMCVFNVSHYYR